MNICEYNLFPGWLCIQYLPYFSCHLFPEYLWIKSPPWRCVTTIPSLDICEHNPFLECNILPRYYLISILLLPSISFCITFHVKDQLFFRFFTIFLQNVSPVCFGEISRCQAVWKCKCVSGYNWHFIQSKLLYFHGSQSLRPSVLDLMLKINVYIKIV